MLTVKLSKITVEIFSLKKTIFVLWHTNHRQCAHSIAVVSWNVVKAEFEEIYFNGIYLKVIKLEF